MSLAGRRDRRMLDGVEIAWRQWPSTIDGQIELGQITDGVPNVVTRPLSVDERAEWDADQQAAVDEADRDAARRAVTNLRAYIDLTSPTAAQRLAFERLVARVLVRLIRDSYA